MFYRKKLHFSSTRQLQSLLIILVVNFRVQYKQECGYSCQLRNGPDIQLLLETQVSSSTLALTDVPIYSPDGIFLGIVDKIPIDKVLYVSPIGNSILFYLIQ